MAKNTSAPSAPRKPRVAKQVSETTRALLDGLKAQLKNAKSLGKILDAVSSFDAATLEKVQDAVTAREKALNEAASEAQS